MSTGPRDPDAVGRGVGVDDEDKAANHALAPSAPTSARTIRPRFIENTLTVQGDGPAAAGDLIPSVSCPFARVRQLLNATPSSGSSGRREQASRRRASGR